MTSLVGSKRRRVAMFPETGLQRLAPVERRAALEQLSGAARWDPQNGRRKTPLVRICRVFI